MTVPHQTNAVDCANRPNPIPYMYWDDYCKQRRKLGERQEFCANCERYRFPDDRCNLFVPSKGARKREGK